MSIIIASDCPHHTRTVNGFAGHTLNLMNPDNNIDNLKNSGLKATLPRLKILEIFQTSEQRHLSAEDVFRILINSHSDIGLATVYRVLTQFEQAGILRRSNFESGKSIYELNEGEHHDHMVCLSCGMVQEFTDSAIEKRQHEIANKYHFALQDHALAMYGLCKDCVAKQQKQTQNA